MLKKRLGLEAIEEYNCLDSYYKISSTLIIPESCERVGDCAFWCCKELKRVVIPGSVVRIGQWAFRDCDRLERVEILDGVEEIGEEAFERCVRATVILKGHKMDFKKIGPFAFWGCRDVKKEVRD